jgi:uncharacterized protein YegP (UPF0339 family)
MNAWLRGIVAGVTLLTVAAVAEAQRSKSTFEVYKDAKDEYRWRLKAANGKVIATPGEGYKEKADCLDAIKSIQAEAGKKGSKMTFETYEDGKGEHRWRLKAANGKVVAVSSQGYKAKADASRGEEILKEAAKAEVKEVEEKE